MVCVPPRSVHSVSRDQDSLSNTVKATRAPPARARCCPGGHMARRQCPRSPRAEDGFHIFTWLQRKSRAGCFVSWEEIYTPVSLRGVSWASPAYASHAAESSDCDRDGRGSRRVPPGASQETVPMAAGRAGDRGAAPASDGACRRSHGFPPGFCSGLACSSCGGPRLRAVCLPCVCTGLLAGGGGLRPAPAPACKRDSRKSCSLRGGSNARWAPSLGAQIRPSGGRG